MSVTFREEHDIGYIELDPEDKKVNILNFETIQQFDKVLDQVANKAGLKAVVIHSLKPGTFIAGADIKEIEKITEPKDGAEKARAGQSLMNKIEDLPYPTIAVIDGAALGGGCELALACYYRVATFSSKVKIGLPEVNLGFVPGFGGTYRLPRTVGLSEGMKMILGGKPVDNRKALRIGLVDRLVPETNIGLHVEQFIAEIIDGKIKRKRYPGSNKRGFSAWLDGNPLGHRLVFNESKKSVMKLSKGFYPAPLKAIDVVSRNLYAQRDQGLDIEAEAFGELAVGEISKNLVKLFYLSEKYKKLSLPDSADTKPVNINKAGVLGAGIMGGGIAQILSSRDIWTRLKDLNHDAVAQGYRAAQKVYDGAVKRRRYTKAEVQRKMAHISWSLDYTGFSDSDIVIEAVVENLDIKKKVIAELNPVLSDKAIVATNTSALSVTEMSNAYKDPSKVVGFHFFNPVHRMPLVEVITTPATSSETVLSALELAKRLGKTPILVKDSAGFIVNRILLIYMNEAGRILEETGQLDAVDRLVTGFGMPMGPFTLSDEVGLDVGLKVLHILEDAFGERFKPVGTFERVLEKKLLGKKSGSGFYVYPKNKKEDPSINFEALSCLPESKRVPLDNDEAIERLVYLMVNEAARCLEEEVVSEADAVDTGMIFGTGFPPFRGGLLRYADSIGCGKIVDRLNALKDKYKDDRFAPCAYLNKLKDEGKGFYE